MIQTAAGVQIPFPERIHEKYIIEKDLIQFNISFEKLEPFFRDFVDGLTEPLFLVLQLPLNQKEEATIRKDEEETRHSEVLYLDGQTKGQVVTILDTYGAILFNDGMSRFGVASHATGDEMFIQKYKVVDIYSKTIDRYVFLLNKYRIEKTFHLITPWETFSYEHPGECNRIKIDNMDVYDIAEKLKQQGMYRAKIEED